MTALQKLQLKIPNLCIKSLQLIHPNHRDSRLFDTIHLPISMIGAQKRHSSWPPLGVGSTAGPMMTKFDPRIYTCPTPKVFGSYVWWCSGPLRPKVCCLFIEWLSSGRKAYLLQTYKRLIWNSYSALIRYLEILALPIMWFRWSIPVKRPMTDKPIFIQLYHVDHRSIPPNICNM